jgi:hypothetical protein
VTGDLLGRTSRPQAIDDEGRETGLPTEFGDERDGNAGVAEPGGQTTFVEGRWVKEPGMRCLRWPFSAGNGEPSHFRVKFARLQSRFA